MWDPSSPPPARCAVCGSTELRAPISVVVIWTPDLPEWQPGSVRPRALPLASPYRPCCGKGCTALLEELDRALPERGLAGWTRTLVLLEDGHGIEVHADRRTPLAARG